MWAHCNTKPLHILDGTYMQSNTSIISGSYISLCKTCDPRGATIFGPQGHNLKNKLDRGPLGNFKAIGIVVSEKNIVDVFPINAYVNHVTPWVGSFLAPGA